MLASVLAYSVCFSVYFLSAGGLFWQSVTPPRLLVDYAGLSAVVLERAAKL
jgi:hypothetical protein